MSPDPSRHEHLSSAALRVLLIDNYDSFTWNLAQSMMQLGAEVRVVLNDRITVEAVREQGWEALVVSPGPGRPEHAGMTPRLIAELHRELPIFGVCLGHQALAAHWGARIVRAPEPMHGKTSDIRHDGRGVFRGLRQGFVATRYHSLVVDPASLPEVFEVAARTDDGVVMGLRHRELPLHGVQFHPESILTLEGSRLVANFLDLASATRRTALPGSSNDGK